eukprot:scaffold184295_cov22-Tisochrysis_lutea.AAC.1
MCGVVLVSHLSRSEGVLARAAAMHALDLGRDAPQKKARTLLVFLWGSTLRHTAAASTRPVCWGSRRERESVSAG